MGGFIAAHATISGTVSSPGIPLSTSPLTGLYRSNNGVGFAVSTLQAALLDAFQLKFGLLNSATPGASNVAGSPFAFANTSNWVTLSSDDRHFYIPNAGVGGGIYAFSHNQTTGSILPIVGSPFVTPASGGVWHCSLSRDGVHLYASDGGRKIYCFTRDNVSGSLTLSSTTAFDINFLSPTGTSVHPSGSYVFVADSASNRIRTYSRNTISGAIALSSLAVASGNPSFIKCSPDGLHLVAVCSGTPGLRIYSIGALGVLTEIVGSPVACGVQPNAVDISPDGTYAFGVDFNGGSSSIKMFTRNAASGLLTMVSSLAMPANAESVSVSGNGSQVCVGSQTSNVVSILNVNTTTNTLSHIAGSPIAGGSQVAFTHDSRNAISTTGAAIYVQQSVLSQVYSLLEGFFSPTSGLDGFLNVNGDFYVKGEKIAGLPITAGQGGKFLVNNGTSLSWSGVSQNVPVVMVANAGNFTIDDSGNYVIDVTGNLTANGALTGAITIPTVPVHVTFHNSTTGGFPLILNLTWTIPPGTSEWYWNGATFHLEGAEPFSTPNVTPLPAAGSAVAINHLCGVAPQQVMILATCITPEFNYVAGDHVQVGEQFNAALVDAIPIWFSSTQAGFNLAAGYSLSAHDKVTGAHVVLTAANWSYNFMVQP